MVLTVSQREREVARRTVHLASDHALAEVRVPLPADADGVLTATLWSAEGKPLAERLLFRESERVLGVQITADTSVTTSSPRAP